MSRSIWCVLLVQHNQDDVPSTWAASVAPTASGCSQQMGPEQHMSPVGWGMWWFQGHNLEKHPEKKKKSRRCMGRCWSNSMNSACMPLDYEVHFRADTDLRFFPY